jgi:hypothetical protein
MYKHVRAKSVETIFLVSFEGACKGNLKQSRERLGLAEVKQLFFEN